MTHSALPDNWEELMADYVLGNLSPQDAEAFKQLLDANPELTTEVAQLQEVLHLIPYAIAQPPPTPLRSRVLAAAQAPISQGSSAPVAQRPPRQRSRRWVGLATTAAAVVLTLGVSIDNYRLRQELQATRVVTQALQQPDTFIETLTGGDNAAGRVMVDANQQVVIIVQNLPALPEGQTYRLWAIAGQTVNLWGQFETDPSGRAIANLTLPVAPEDLSNVELRITIESAAAPPTPQGPVVLKSSL